MEITAEERKLLKACLNTPEGDAASNKVWVQTVADKLKINFDTCTRILGGLKKKEMITAWDEGLSFQLTSSGIAASEL